jgi:hypothetical protein
MNCKNCKLPILSGQVYQVRNAHEVEHLACPRVLTKKEVLYWHRKEIAKMKRQIEMYKAAIRRDG